REKIFRYLAAIELAEKLRSLLFISRVATQGGEAVRGECDEVRDRQPARDILDVRVDAAVLVYHQNHGQFSGGIRRTNQVAADGPVALWRLHRCRLSLDAAVVLRDLDRPGVIGPEHLEQRSRRDPPDREFLRTVEKLAPVNFTVHVKVEQVQKLLREIGCFLSFHRSAPYARALAQP